MVPAGQAGDRQLGQQDLYETFGGFIVQVREIQLVLAQNGFLNFVGVIQVFSVGHTAAHKFVETNP